MSENSKSRQEVVKQLADVLHKQERQGTSINFFERLLEFVSSPKKSGWELVKKTTILEGNVETKKFIVCFDYLNDDTCTFDQFNTAKIRSLFSIFKQVTSCEVNNFPNLKLVRDTVRKTGPYISLFNKLSPDADSLLECELSGEGRLFFFITENKFNVVSIEGNHRNLH